MDKEGGLKRDVKLGRVGHQKGPQLKGEIIPQPKKPFAA